MFNIGDKIICIKETVNFLHNSKDEVIHFECINIGEPYIISDIGYDDYLEQYFTLKGKRCKYFPSYFETLQQNRIKKINKLKSKKNIFLRLINKFF